MAQNSNSNAINTTPTTILTNEEWIKENNLGNEVFTEWLLRKLGRWDSAQYLRKTCQWVGTGYKTYYYRLTVGNKVYDASYQVTGPRKDDFYAEYQEVDLRQEDADRKEYGRKVSLLAKAAGVPWKLAALLSSKEDTDRERNLAALKKAKEVHNSRLDKSTLHELVECGISRRCEKIANLLGDLTEQFNCSGQIKSRRLAEYLAGYNI